jgi:hypothetical protein
MTIGERIVATQKGTRRIIPNTHTLVCFMATRAVPWCNPRGRHPSAPRPLLSPRLAHSCLGRLRAICGRSPFRTRRIPPVMPAPACRRFFFFGWGVAREPTQEPSLRRRRASRLPPRVPRAVHVIVGTPLPQTPEATARARAPRPH